MGTRGFDRAQQAYDNDYPAYLEDGYADLDDVDDDRDPDLERDRRMDEED